MASKGRKLGFIPPVVKDGKSVASLQQSEIAKMHSKWEISFILFVVGYTPTIASVARFILLPRTGTRFKSLIWFCMRMVTLFFSLLLWMTRMRFFILGLTLFMVNLSLSSNGLLLLILMLRSFKLFG